MQECIIFDKEEFDNLPSLILGAIIETAMKKWGCKFISRETGEEESGVSIYGLFISPIEKVLKNTKGE